MARVIWMLLAIGMVILAWPLLIAGLLGVALALAVSAVIGLWWFRRWWKQLSQELEEMERQRQAVQPREPPTIHVEAETVEEEK